VSDEQLIKIAKIASVVIALFSFIVSPLLQYAPEGLFQIIRIFTGFYNIPVIAIVLVGLFTKRVPPIAAKIVIVLHVITYGLLKFIIDVDINFIHIYAILFFAEVGLMLLIGYWRPLNNEWHYHPQSKVNMTPWKYALPVSFTLFSCLVCIYLFFSPIGVVGGLSPYFWPLIAGVALTNMVLCYLSMQRWQQRYAAQLHWNEESTN
ncbi:MAG TPA: hypothetical protein VLA24_12810, partial [Pseudomonadales bacterium]|nr:hypothetical protein [Pseudomonadales bacterium]